MKVFGSKAYAHKIDSKLTSDFAPKAKIFRFVGLSESQKGFRLMDPSSRKILVRSDVKFDEQSFSFESIRSAFTTEKQIPDLMVLNREKRIRNPNLNPDYEYETAKSASLPAKTVLVSETLVPPSNSSSTEKPLEIVKPGSSTPEIMETPTSGIKLDALLSENTGCSKYLVSGKSCTGL